MNIIETGPSWYQKFYETHLKLEKSLLDFASFFHYSIDRIFTMATLGPI